MLGVAPRRGRFVGERRPSVRQVLGVDVSGLLVDQQGAGPTALLAVRTAGQGFRESALPLRAGRITACPAVGCMLGTLPLRIGTISARQASGKDELMLAGCLARLGSRSAEKDRDTSVPADGAAVTVSLDDRHNHIYPDPASSRAQPVPGRCPDP